jgi:hypothetical protein
MANQFSPTPSADNLLVGKGEVWFNRFDALGIGTGLRHLGNVDAMEITTEDDVLEKYSNMSADAPLYKKVPRRRNVGIRLTLSEFDPHNLAIVTMGTVVETSTQAATPVTGEVLSTDVVLGAHYKFAKLGPHTAIALTTGVTPLVLDTDYKVVNPDVGIIQILPTASNISAGDPLTAAYTPTAYTAGEIVEVLAGESSTIEGSLLFIGDPATGPRKMVEVWKVSFNPDGALALISDEFADVGIQGNVLADPTGHPNNKLYKVTYLPF